MINWKVRYSKLIDRNRELLDQNNSILEVGCGQYGIAQYLKRPVNGIELNPVRSLCEWLTVQQGSVLDLPFSDGKFDYVICVDVIEHLKPEDRSRAFAELLRVTGERLIVSCPIRQYGEIGEASIAAWFDARYGERPDWLKEHISNGLPDTNELLKWLIDSGFKFDLYGNEGMLQHYGGLFLDYEFPLAQKLLELHNHKTIFESPLGKIEWDLYYSYACEVYKKHPLKSTLQKQSHYVDTTVSREAVIYAACHKRELVADFGQIKPLLTGVGAVDAPQGFSTDFLQDGTRLLNTRWSELSGIFKIWQNGPKTDVVGFSHYRRFFDFSGEEVHGFQRIISRAELLRRRSQLFDESLIAKCHDTTVLLPRPFELVSSPWDQYSYAHNADDICLLISIISEHAPELLPYVDKLTCNRSFYAFNMFVMNWRVFDCLCKVWFSVLLEFERRVPANRASAYQNRDISFLSERLFDIWIRFAKDNYALNLVELPIFFVNEDIG